jgi:microcystin-dependent protein
LRSSPDVELPSGTIIQGSPYVAVYNQTNGDFYLRNFYGNPYNIPLAAGLDYWGTTAPNSAFAFPAGQAISRTAYATLFAIMGTTYGGGDGTTTFNLPDKTGRVSAMKETTATRLTSSYFGGNSTAMGAFGGLETHTLLIAEMPAHSHANTLNDPGHTHNTSPYGLWTNQSGGAVGTGVAQANSQILATIPSATTGITIANASQGGGSAHNIVQPTIVCNYIIRIF